MSNRSEKLLIEDIIEAIDNIFEYTENMTMQIFVEDKKTRDAVVRNFEIIGEASNKLPKIFIEQNTQIDWSGLIGFRNVLIHKYFGVDYETIWEIIETELSDIDIKMKQLLQKL
jgi:uncharacterized protein with HEPN domain